MDIGLRKGVLAVQVFGLACGVGFGAAPAAFAHGGGLNAEGCHNNRKAGYGPHLDRDGDGVGCE